MVLPRWINNPRQTCHEGEQSCNSFNYRTPNRLHDVHQGLSSTLHRARRTLYWPKLQDDITEIVQTCRLRLRKVRQQEAQNSRTADFSNTADGNSAHRFGGLPGQHTLVTVHYFSGFLAYDILNSKANSHKSAVQHLQEVWKINSHNGPCLKFRSFCDQLDIVNITSSPPYNQRVVRTTEQILKSMGDTDITKALTIFLHTLVSDTLLSTAELFFNRKINTSLSMIMTQVPWTD